MIFTLLLFLFAALTPHFAFIASLAPLRFVFMHTDFEQCMLSRFVHALVLTSHHGRFNLSDSVLLWLVRLYVHVVAVGFCYTR